MLLFIKLIRVPNLIIIILTQYLTRFCILQPLLESQEISLQFSELDFFLLVLSTILIAGAGYIINDYFDLKIDNINKTEKIIIGRKISIKNSIILYVLMNVIAIGVGFYISQKVGNIKYVLIFVFIGFLLLFYSAKYKNKFLSGNLIVSFLSAFVIIIVWIYEILALGKNQVSIASQWEVMKLLVLGYSIFAFLVSLAREIIKDIQDVEGDRKFGCRTIPVVIGITNSKLIVVVITILTMLILAYGQYLFFIYENNFICFYFILIQLLFIYLIFTLIKANEIKDFRFSGNLSKLIMLAGILSMLFLLIK